MQRNLHAVPKPDGADAELGEEGQTCCHMH